MRRVPFSEGRVVPWRNGGGTTTELLVGPVQGERFLYRLSAAEVASDGPFSRFDGYDRHIMLLAGRGMELDCGPKGVLPLASRWQPQAFSGDWDVRGRLFDGPVRDLNLIVDRARAASSLEVLPCAAPMELACAAGEVVLVHVLEGKLADADAHDTLLVDANVTLTPRPTATLAIGRATPRRGPK